jgi:BCCT family betaine/carnitine transporter
MAAAMGPYHWGGIAWTIYIVCGVACAYIMYVRKSKVFRISEACRGVFGDKVDGLLGKVIDIGFMFGLIGAAATAFGLQTPFIARLISQLTGIEDGTPLRLGVLFGVAIIFGITSYLGIEKGMKRISDANVVMAILFLLIVLFSGSAVYTLKMATTSLGLIAENFITMSSWMDPQGVSGGFPEWWTVFYWAWSAMYAPFYGLFFAKISKGRTMGQMIAGTVGFGSLGCFFVFEILGGYGMFLNTNGIIDVVKMQAELGDAGLVVGILSNLPAQGIVLSLLLIVIVLFSATTYDATSGVLASVSQYQLDDKGESKPWLRLLWAGLLVVLPAGFIMSGSQLGPLQTITIIFALPVTIICIITVISFFKMVKQDIAAGTFVMPTKK